MDERKDSVERDEARENYRDLRQRLMAERDRAREDLEEALSVISSMRGSFLLMGFRTDDEGLKSLQDAEALLRKHNRIGAES